MEPLDRSIDLTQTCATICLRTQPWLEIAALALPRYNAIVRHVGRQLGVCVIDFDRLLWGGELLHRGSGGGGDGYTGNASQLWEAGQGAYFIDVAHPTAGRSRRPLPRTSCPTRFFAGRTARVESL